PRLCAEAPVHPEPQPADHPLGARRGARGHAAADRSRAAEHDEAEAQAGGAPLRDLEGLDGIHPLPDEAAEERENSDHPPRPGLQSEAGDADPRNRAAARRHPSLSGERVSASDHLNTLKPRPSFYTASVGSGSESPCGIATLT